METRLFGRYWKPNTAGPRQDSRVILGEVQVRFLTVVVGRAIEGPVGRE